MTAKKEPLIAGVFSHKNLGQLVKQQEEHMMKNVDVAEGCNFLKYQLTEFQLVFYSQMNLTSVHSKQKQYRRPSTYRRRWIPDPHTLLTVLRMRPHRLSSSGEFFLNQSSKFPTLLARYSILPLIPFFLFGIEYF
jgi:hypothetical protein